MNKEFFKKNKYILITISIGILSLIAAISTIFGILGTTKDYRLIKNNIDVFLENTLTEKSEDGYYESGVDTEYVYEIENGYRIDVEKIKENNNRYLKNDYFINIGGLINSNESTSELLISDYISLVDSNNKEVASTSASGSNLFIEKTYFDDSISYFDLTIVNLLNDEITHFINEIYVSFYSYYF